MGSLAAGAARRESGCRAFVAFAGNPDGQRLAADAITHVAMSGTINVAPATGTAPAVAVNPKQQLLNKGAMDGLVAVSTPPTCPCR